MEEKVDNIKDLNNDDLLSLHATILEHLKYLEEHIISVEEEQVEDENAEVTDDSKEENSNVDGGDDSE